MKKLKKPSDAETAILTVLWDSQPCSVKDIHDALSSQKDVGYTTTLKQVQRMHEKGFLSRERGEGKSYNYRAIISEEETKSHLFDRFVETAFGNSVSDLVMHAIGKSDASDAEVQKIKNLLKDIDTKT